MKIYILPLVILLVSCDGPYKDLEERYPIHNETSVEILTPERLVLTSQHYKGAFSFKGINKIQLENKAVFIDLNSFFHDSIEIPIESVSGCSCTYFNKGNWDADLILGDDGIEIGIHLSNETKDWCYKSSLPVITGKQKRAWLYDKEPLPSYENYVQVDRESFDYQFKQACMGY